MAYTAKDGHTFPSSIQLRKYEEAEGNLWRPSLTDSMARKGAEEVSDAPGGPSQEEAVRQHGLAKKVTITREGNGRHRIEAQMADGSSYTSVHPEAYRAHDIAKDLLGIEAPPAFQTAGRARSQPIGPKEEERIRWEDGREEGVFGPTT